MPGLVAVFVHGWSVHNTSTYGGFPERLRSEGRADPSLGLDVKEIHLGKYVSFRDEVRVPDIAEAFEAALRREVLDRLPAGTRVAVITHSTGGPVAREWWRRYYRATGRPCPASHLVMLAPANFGSALAQVGASRLGRLKAAAEGIQPGEGVLEWLALGSEPSRTLNLDWIRSTSHPWRDPAPVFPFVLTGQCLDRSLYDHIVPYTGEDGGDGVVRAAAANLDAGYLRLVQRRTPGAGPDVLEVAESALSPPAAFRLVEGRSHSGDAMGILRSARDDGQPHPTVTQVLRCLRVGDAPSYENLRDAFAKETEQVRKDERVEESPGLLSLFPRRWVRDPHTMIVFRLEDDAGHVPERFDIVLVGGRGKEVGPDHLPPGFFVDRQRNDLHGGTITYFVNHALMLGSPAVRDSAGKVVRKKTEGVDVLGLEVNADPAQGFTHYRPAALEASAEIVEKVIRPDSTVLVDIVLDRVVHEGVFRLTKRTKPEEFKDDGPGDALA